MNLDDVSENHALPNEPAPGRGMSLRTKGFWMLVFFILFTSLTGMIIVREHGALYANVQQLHAVHMEEEYQIGLNMRVAHAVLVMNENYYQPDITLAAQKISTEIGAVIEDLKEEAKFRPLISEHILALEAAQQKLSTHPSREALAEAQDSLDLLVTELSAIASQLRAREIELLEKYNLSFEKLSIEWTLIAAISFMLLGGLVMIFVSRLAWDIRRIQDRAIEIVNGYRGEPLTVTRQDELGALMEAVNKMQHELRMRETTVELSRQQQFHKDKMAAVGSLAAAVAHEINNPLAAISGLSQSMTELQATHQCGKNPETCHPEMLYEQARRIMDITRQIFEFTVPQSASPELLDINNLIRNTARFVSFDRRFHLVEIIYNLDPQLPAVHVVADHLTQIVMNLLINATDALEGQTSPRPRITLSTLQSEDAAIITVADNGSGMSQETLARVFEEFFTTKPPGKGSGIGLAISKSLIESSGGSISIESAPGMGTIVTLRLPVATSH